MKTSLDGSCTGLEACNRKFRSFLSFDIVLRLRSAENGDKRNRFAFCCFFFFRAYVQTTKEPRVKEKMKANLHVFPFTHSPSLIEQTRRKHRSTNSARCPVLLNDYVFSISLSLSLLSSLLSRFARLDKGNGFDIFFFLLLLLLLQRAVCSIGEL